MWRNYCYICCFDASLFFGLFFMMWLFLSSHFPSRHLSPCQHGEAHCRQYPCLWTHWWCSVAQLWLSPSTNHMRSLSAASVGRWPLDIVSVLWNMCVLVWKVGVCKRGCMWQNSVICQVTCFPKNRRGFMRSWKPKKKHLHLLFSEC